MLDRLEIYHLEHANGVPVFMNIVFSSFTFIIEMYRHEDRVKSILVPTEDVGSRFYSQIRTLDAGFGSRISTSVPPSHTLPRFIMGEIDLWSSYAAGDETGISAHPFHLFVVG